MAIGVDGQYYVTFDLNVRGKSKLDFISEDDFYEFDIVETAGGKLPEYKLHFKTTDIDIIQYMNRGNSVRVNYGPDKLNQITTDLAIVHPTIMRSGSGAYDITLTGFYNAVNYLQSPVTKIYAGINSTEAIRQAVENYFPVFDTNYQALDVQNWVSYGIPASKFVQQTWLHSYVGENTFPMLGISSSGRFILRDALTLVSEKKSNYDWVFATESPDSIRINGAYAIKFSDELMAQWASRDIQQTGYNMETGLDDILKSDATPILTAANHSNRNKVTAFKRALPTYTSDATGNVHVNYRSAYLQNITMLAAHSSVKLVINYDNELHPIQVLDYVFFRDDELNSKSADRHISGSYFVSLVSRAIRRRSMSTRIELSKETPADMVGDLR